MYWLNGKLLTLRENDTVNEFNMLFNSFTVDENVSSWSIRESNTL